MYFFMLEFAIFVNLLLWRWMSDHLLFERMFSPLQAGHSRQYIGGCRVIIGKEYAPLLQTLPISVQTDSAEKYQFHFRIWWRCASVSRNFTFCLLKFLPTHRTSYSVSNPINPFSCNARPTRASCWPLWTTMLLKSNNTGNSEYWQV